MVTIQVGSYCSDAWRGSRTNQKVQRKGFYRTISTFSEDPMAETSSLKVQAAALNMIVDLSRNKRSASALEAILKKVFGLVMGIACSSVVGLHDAAVNALSGLACIDPDLIWLLVADVYHSLKRKDIPLPPPISLPEISQLLPSPSSHKEFLFAQYEGDSVVLISPISKP